MAAKTAKVEESWQDRVLAEKAELDKKIEELEEFINSDMYLNISVADRELLLLQRMHMQNYSGTLNERILRF